MDDPLLVRVLHCLTNRGEQFQPLRGGQPVLVAVIGDPDATHQLHDKIRTPRLGRARIQHARDVRMIHHRQRLTLRFEPRYHLPRIHAGLEYLQRHAPPHRLRLFRHVNDPPAALTDLLQQLVAPHGGVFLHCFLTFA